MDESTDGRWSRARDILARWGLPVLLYGILAGFLIGPAYMDSEERIIGGGELGGWLWRYWWMKLEIVALGAEFPHEPLTRFLYIVSLGRFPETGNITDLYAISLPLDLIFGHPGYYNVKLFLIFLTNALAAYAYVLYLTDRRGVSLIAGMTLACNVFVFLEIQQSGLRQAILCFVPLFALFLDRMFHEKKLWLGAAAGVSFAAVSVFYWFFGLFMAAFALLRVVHFFFVRRMRPAEGLWRPIVLAAALSLLLALPFMWPYLSKDYQDPNAAQLPEVTWLQDFPSVHALQNVDIRPGDPRSNLLASLARVLTSSWPADWVFNPIQTRVVPTIMVLFGIALGLWRWRKTGFWLVVFALFYSLTWGPYLKMDGDYVHIFGEYLVRLPYWYAFKFVPFVSRLFGPYRMGAIVVFSMTVLLGLNLAAIARRMAGWPKLRILLGVLFVGLYLGHFFIDPMRYLGIGSNHMLPLQASSVAVPEWYHELASEKGRIGIFELPHLQQQNLLSYYQTIHGKRVYGGADGGWATPGALPPRLRFSDGHPSKVKALLHWLSEPETLHGNSFAQGIRSISTMPYVLNSFSEADLEAVRTVGYRYVVLHELGCYQKEPRWGKELYQRMKNQLEGALGPPVTEFVEFDQTGDAEDMIPYLNGMPWVPSMYAPLLIPEPRPWPLRMAVYSLGHTSSTDDAGSVGQPDDAGSVGQPDEVSSVGQPDDGIFTDGGKDRTGQHDATPIIAATVPPSDDQTPPPPGDVALPPAAASPARVNETSPHEGEREAPVVATPSAGAMP